MAVLNVSTTLVQAAKQGLFRRQSALTAHDLIAHAAEIGLDEERFRADFAARKGLPRIEADVES